HEVEELRPGRMHGALDAGDELLERPFGADAVLGKVAAERGGHLFGAGVTHVPIGDRLEVARGLARREVDDLRELGGVGRGDRGESKPVHRPPGSGWSTGRNLHRGGSAREANDDRRAGPEGPSPSSFRSYGVTAP